MIVSVIVEIPKRSNIKYEYNVFTKSIFVDRILTGPHVYPHNYGFIPSTLDYDGDPLDIMIIHDQAFVPGVQIPVRIIGALEMIDNGEIDTKLIGVVDCDVRYRGVALLSDINLQILLEIKSFFEHYKDGEDKKVLVNDFVSKDEALAILKHCQDLFVKHKVYYDANDPVGLKKALLAENK